MRRHVVVPLLVLVTLGLVACGSKGTASSVPNAARSAQQAATTGTTAVPVVKDVLATEADPPGAPGRTLTLIRYTIAPGAQLSPHIHPGVQLASIQSGSLTYTVISGTAEVTRAGGETESINGPSTITLGPGDAVAENDGMVHFGANQTGEPVIILASLLTEDGKDLAVTVTTTGTGTGTTR